MMKVITEATEDGKLHVITDAWSGLALCGAPRDLEEKRPVTVCTACFQALCEMLTERSNELFLLSIPVLSLAQYATEQEMETLVRDLETVRQQLKAALYIYRDTMGSNQEENQPQ